jgi:hypothetical protein
VVTARDDLCAHAHGESNNGSGLDRGAHCFRSHRCASASQTQSANNRFRSGKSGSPLTKKSKRSQSSSPGHLPVHTRRRGSSAWKCAQPSADQPQCGQRSISQPVRWRSPMGAPQSGHVASFLLVATRFAVRWSVNRSLIAVFYFHTRGHCSRKRFVSCTLAFAASSPCFSPGWR